MDDVTKKLPATDASQKDSSQKTLDDVLADLEKQYKTQIEPADSQAKSTVATTSPAVPTVKNPAVSGVSPQSSASVPKPSTPMPLTTKSSVPAINQEKSLSVKTPLTQPHTVATPNVAASSLEPLIEHPLSGASGLSAIKKPVSVQEKITTPSVPTSVTSAMKTDTSLQQNKDATKAAEQTQATGLMRQVKKLTPKQIVFGALGGVVVTLLIGVLGIQYVFLTNPTYKYVTLSGILRADCMACVNCGDDGDKPWCASIPGGHHIDAPPKEGETRTSRNDENAVHDPALNSVAKQETVAQQQIQTAKTETEKRAAEAALAEAQAASEKKAMESALSWSEYWKAQGRDDLASLEFNDAQARKASMEKYLAQAQAISGGGTPGEIPQEWKDLMSTSYCKGDPGAAYSGSGYLVCGGSGGIDAFCVPQAVHQGKSTCNDYIQQYAPSYYIGWGDGCVYNRATNQIDQSTCNTGKEVPWLWNDSTQCYTKNPGYNGDFGIVAALHTCEGSGYANGCNNPAAGLSADQNSWCLPPKEQRPCGTTYQLDIVTSIPGSGYDADQRASFRSIYDRSNCTTTEVTTLSAPKYNAPSISSATSTDSTPQSSPPPGSPICAGLDTSLPAPKLGESPVFTCTQAQETTRYEFRYKIGAGSYQSLSPSAAGSNTSLPLTVNTSGEYTVQCRPCNTNGCTNWENI